MSPPTSPVPVGREDDRRADGAAGPAPGRRDSRPGTARTRVVATARACEHVVRRPDRRRSSPTSLRAVRGPRRPEPAADLVVESRCPRSKTRMRRAQSPLNDLVGQPVDVAVGRPDGSAAVADLRRDESELELAEPGAVRVDHEQVAWRPGGCRRRRSTRRRASRSAARSSARWCRCRRGGCGPTSRRRRRSRSSSPWSVEGGERQLAAVRATSRCTRRRSPGRRRPGSSSAFRRRA